ncbi:MAG: anthranilate phosphoribosyltransferase [Candidatus Margulisiibacteriota bacterium]
MIKDCIKKLVEGQDLTSRESEEAMNDIMTGIATPSQIASLITALRIKGETSEEITGFAKIMRAHAVKLSPKADYFVDTCGTGGDVSGTFNISTVASFIAAGSGVVIAKHGNRAVSSKCGSADLLEKLGVMIDIPPEKVASCIDSVGLGFIFAPAFHQAMKHATPTRKEIGIRTIFNILGPVSNPANTKGQLMGVYSEKLTLVMAEVLKNQGCETAMVVYGTDGIDEISISGSTKVSHLSGGIIKEYFVEPENFGIKKQPLSSISGGSSEENAGITKNILEGKEKGARRDVVLLNAAAAIVVGKKAADIKEGLELAKRSLDSGAALDKLKKLIEFTAKH